MKKTFVALVVFLMLCVAAVSAKSSGLGSLGKNLSALSGNAKAAEGTVPEGWFITVKVLDPDVFTKVKNGTFKMFSIQGNAKRIKL